MNVVNSKVSIGGDDSNLVVGNGQRVSRQLSVPAGGVNGIDLSGVFDAEIVCNKQPATVELVTDENLQGLAIVTVVDGVLSVRFAKPVQTQQSPHLKVSVPALTRLNLGGGDTVRVKGIDEKRFSLEHEGTGSVRLAGRAETLLCKVSGVGEVDAGNLKTREADITVTGVGNVTCRPEKKLKALLSGIGGVRCLTRPTEVEKDGTGLGEVEFVGGR